MITRSLAFLAILAGPLVAGCALLGMTPEPTHPPRPQPIAPDPRPEPAPLPVAQPEPPTCDTPCTKTAAQCSADGEALVHAKDPKEVACARAWLDDACTRGDMKACNGYGYMLVVGLGGVGDREKAQALLTRACDAKVPVACINLASTYETTDPARAYAAYADLCDHGTFDACWLAGDLVAAGRGIPKDSARASELYDRACKHGIPIACQRMPAVAH